MSILVGYNIINERTISHAYSRGIITEVDVSFLNMYEIIICLLISQTTAKRFIHKNNWIGKIEPITVCECNAVADPGFYIWVGANVFNVGGGKVVEPVFPSLTWI